MKSLFKDKKLIICISATLIILLIIGSIILLNNGNKNNSKSKNMIKNYVAFVKINPSIKLEYTQTCKETNEKDVFDCDEPVVTKYELINEDAKNIYKDIDLLGSSKDLLKVLNLICETAKDNGIAFEKVDIYSDWDKIENYINEKKEISDTIKFNIEITNKDDITTKIEVDENNTITYNVSFDTDGGSNIESQVIKKDEIVTKPKNPTKNGYNFIEWQLNDKAFDFNTKISKDITLKAKWTKEEKNNNSNSNNDSTNNSNNTSNNSNNTSNNSNNTSSSNSNNTTNNNSENNQSSSNTNTQQPVTLPIEEDTHKGVINLNENVMYMYGGSAWKCDNCIPNSIIQKIRTAKGICDKGSDSNGVWFRSLSIPEGKYSNPTYWSANLDLEMEIYNSGAEMEGGEGDGPFLLTEQVCNEYHLSCDRW